ncbi:MAG: C39 family peptidase, partial [Bacteroidaceae bacterium]|nr:C39 family peptidase [Bacteroidaceae bacterium]
MEYKNKNNYISDELLAAYLDGNTNEAETLTVLKALECDSELREVMDIAMGVEDDVVQWTGAGFLPMMQLAAESGENICSVLCEAFILHRRGIAFDEKEMLGVAQQNHWLTPQGTPLHAVGQLLAHYGLMVTRKYDATIEDIQKALARDNDVLVAVDSDKLHPELPDEEDAPNHVVVVTSINAEGITIYDP